MSQKYRTRIVECQECQGDGKIWLNPNGPDDKGFTCPMCHGRGHVVERIEPEEEEQ